MKEGYDNVKNYLLHSIYNISIFNCKKLDFDDERYIALVEKLATYIVDKWKENE